MAAAGRAVRAGTAARRAEGVATAPFESALSRDDVAVIAEIKRRSPSRGLIKSDIEAAHQAREYAAGGAAAISVLTEPTRFGGSPEDLEQAVHAVSVPVLRKDFIVSHAQLNESIAIGATAALLIARALPARKLAELAAHARDIGLELLFEVRTEAELGAALQAGARVIGVNNRDLETLEVDPATVDRLLPLVPPDLVAVAESGYTTRASVEAAARSGADAVLVGTAVSEAADPRAAVALLTGIPKVGRSMQGTS